MDENDGFCINGDRPLSMFVDQEVIGNMRENPDTAKQDARSIEADNYI